MSQEETRQAECFFDVFECIHQKKGCAVSAMFGTESMLRWVEHVEVFPGVADAVGENACPELAENFQEADGPQVFDVGEFGCFGQWDEPALFPEVGDMLGGPYSAEHVVRGLVEVFWECLQVSV